jgi:hypothetical protein
MYFDDGWLVVHGFCNCIIVIRSLFYAFSQENANLRAELEVATDRILKQVGAYATVIVTPFTMTSAYIVCSGITLQRNCNSDVRTEQTQSYRHHSTMQAGILLTETVEELREQLDISLKEVSILKDEVDTLMKQKDQLQAITAERHSMAVASIGALAKAEESIKTLRAEKSRCTTIVFCW